MAKDEKDKDDQVKTPGAAGPSGSGGKLWAACKLPAGLVLRTFKMRDTVETTLAGTRDVRVAQQAGPPVKLNGSAVPIGHVPQHRIVHGYGLTVIDEDVWQAWLKDNKDSALIVNAMVSAHRDEASAVAWASENAKRQTGLEELSQDKDPRAQRLLTPGLVGLGSRTNDMPQAN